jgi:uracil-DNA glycosylase
MEMCDEWLEFISQESEKDYYKNLMSFLVEERANHTIYPYDEDMFKAFDLTPLNDVKVVILGQDPYIKYSDEQQCPQAHGLAFSVPENVAIPKSLNNIFIELCSDIGITMPNSGSLVGWANQGVLLLNTVLTVRAGESNSHKGKGWEQFTNNVITLLNAQNKPIVFMLWGRNAQTKKQLINNPSHLILEAAHPSPLSAYSGFFGCKHFSKANAFLKNKESGPIDWQKTI